MKESQPLAMVTLLVSKKIISSMKGEEEMVTNNIMILEHVLKNYLNVRIRDAVEVRQLQSRGCHRNYDCLSGPRTPISLLTLDPWQEPKGGGVAAKAESRAKFDATAVTRVVMNYLTITKAILITPTLEQSPG